FDVFKGAPPTLAGELRTLAGTLAHGPRFACMNGPVLAAHSLGRVRAAVRPGTDPAAPDYLSGRSGIVGGKRGALRVAADEVLDALLVYQSLDTYDWVLFMDDDVGLPAGWLDAFLLLAERFDLVLAQPAHRLAGHAAWTVTRRRPGSLVRETGFVEIGPLTA